MKVWAVVHIGAEIGSSDDVRSIWSTPEAAENERRRLLANKEAEFDYELEIREGELNKPDQFS